MTQANADKISERFKVLFAKNNPGLPIPTEEESRELVSYKLILCLPDSEVDRILQEIEYKINPAVITEDQIVRLCAASKKSWGLDSVPDEIIREAVINSLGDCTNYEALIKSIEEDDDSNMKELFASLNFEKSV